MVICCGDRFVGNRVSVVLAAVISMMYCLWTRTVRARGRVVLDMSGALTMFARRQSGRQRGTPAGRRPTLARRRTVGGSQRPVREDSSEHRSPCAEHVRRRAPAGGRDPERRPLRRRTHPASPRVVHPKPEPQPRTPNPEPQPRSQKPSPDPRTPAPSLYSRISMCALASSPFLKSSAALLNASISRSPRMRSLACSKLSTSEVRCSTIFRTR
jgi:hypothetical protein